MSDISGTSGTWVGHVGQKWDMGGTCQTKVGQYQTQVGCGWDTGGMSGTLVGHEWDEWDMSGTRMGRVRQKWDNVRHEWEK